MPETHEEKEAAREASKEDIADRVEQEWSAMSELMDNIKIPKTIKPSEIKLPEGMELDEAGLEAVAKDEDLYLTEPERLSFLAGKCAYYVKAASRRKISDFAALSRFMEKTEKKGENIYFILQSDGTCYLANERSGAPSEIWATVDEMAVDMNLKEEGK